MQEKIYVRPLVPRYLYDFTKTVMDALPNSDQLLAIHHAKVSLIRNPYEIKNAFPGKSMGNFAFEGSVDLLLVSPAPERKPIAAFDLYHGASARFQEQKKCFFKAIGLFYFSGNKRLWRESLPELIQGFSAYEIEGVDTSGIINRTQWDVMSRLAEKAKKLNLYLLHEVSLDSVIAVSQGSDDRSDMDTPLFMNKNYLRQTSFDAVIATAPPNCKPVCVIEFDGRVHESPDKQLKDDKKNQACSQARLPLIRIPSVDVKEAELGRTVVEIREQAQIQRAEVSWIVVEELLKALAEGHFSSRWYLSQLHHFLCLEADSISELDPDSSDTLRDYAGELWRLSEGRIRDLELQVAGQSEGMEDLYSWDQWLKDYHYSEYEWAEEELSRIWDYISDFRERLERDFDDMVFRDVYGINLVDLEFNKLAVAGRPNASRYTLRLEGNELLSALGLSIKPRVIELGPIGIAVSGDALGATEKLIDKVAGRYLLRSARDIVGAYRPKILQTLETGEHIMWQFMAARVWSRIPVSSIESEIKSLLKAALIEKELDFTRASPQQLKDFFDFKPSAVPTRDVPFSERQNRLLKARRNCRSALEQTTMCPKQKSSLAALIDEVSKELEKSLNDAGS